MEKRDLFDSDALASVRDRIGKLTPDTAARWGEMDAGQMMAHCSEILEVSMGKPLKTPFIGRLLAPLVKRYVLSDKPYQRSLRTHPKYLIKGAVNFDEQKKRLLDRIDAFEAGGRRALPHSLFGTLTPEEGGWANFKHLDHHLEQFGV